MGRGDRNYQRHFLRAPYFNYVLITEGKYVYRTQASNISEGGLFMRYAPFVTIPKETLHFMFCLPTMPRFKNLSSEQIQMQDPLLFPQKVIRISGKIVRSSEITDDATQMVINGFGIEFQRDSQSCLLTIAEYVKTSASNIIYLKALMGSGEKEKIRRLLGLMGYPEEAKMSWLRRLVDRDYINLQWL